MNSSTDVIGKSNYYEYDSSERLKVQRDENFSILSENKYNLLNEVSECFDCDPEIGLQSSTYQSFVSQILLLQ